jgi:hypothetical protein
MKQTRIPVGVIFMVDIDDQLPMSAHAFTNLAAHLNSAINPIFYYVFNPKIREGYRAFFNILTCKRFFKPDNKKHMTSVLDSVISHSILLK